MGLGSYAGGISRGIQNGVNIGLALRADKRTEANDKLGIQRMEKADDRQAIADDRATTLFNQKLEDREEKERLSAINRSMKSAAFMSGRAGGPKGLLASEFTDIGLQSGALPAILKPNQTNPRYSPFKTADGQERMIIQFNQKGEDGELILDDKGQAKWFAVSEGRGTNDKGVLFTKEEIFNHNIAAYIEQGGDLSVAESLFNKGMTEREKIALKHGFKIAEQNNDAKNKLKGNRSGAGVKPTYKTDANGNTFAIFGNKAVPVQVPASNRTIRQRKESAQADALAQGVPDALLRPVEQFNVPRTDVLQQTPKKAFTDRVISDETGNARVVREYDLSLTHISEPTRRKQNPSAVVSW